MSVAAEKISQQEAFPLKTGEARLCPLPDSIMQFLKLFKLRKNILMVGRSLGITLAITLLLAMILCAIDRLLHLSAAIRLSLLLTLMVTAMVCFVWQIQELFGRRSWIYVADNIESRTAIFHQRLQTLVSRSLGENTQSGSASMLRSIADQVVELIRQVRLSNLLPLKMMLPGWIGVVVVAGVFAVFWKVPAIGLPSLVARLLHPSAAVGPVTLTQLSIDPAGAEVSPGGTVVISATVGGSQLPDVMARGVELHLSTDNIHWTRARMVNSSAAKHETRFAFAVPAIDRSLHYYVTAGDAQSETFEIHVKRVPAAAQFKIRYTLPAYTSHQSVNVVNTDGLIEVLEGSLANITLVSTEPLASATLLFDGRKIEMQATTNPNEWTALTRVWSDGLSSLEMVSTAGVTGRGPSPMLIRALPDREPSLVIQEPSMDLRLSEKDVVTFNYSATDDFGLKSLSFVQKRLFDEAHLEPISLQDVASRKEGTIRIDLARMKLQIGDQLDFSLSSRDSAGNEKNSEVRRIVISPESVDVRSYAVAAELRRSQRLATLWNASLVKLRDAVNQNRVVDVRTGKQDLSTNANHVLSASMESQALFRTALFRTLARCDSANTSAILCTMLDETSITPVEGNRIAPIAKGDTSVVDRINQRIARAKLVNQWLRVLLFGQYSYIALAETHNVKALTAIKPPATNSSSAAAYVAANRTAIDRANHAVDDMVREINALQGESVRALGRKANDFEQQLQSRIKRIADLSQQQHRVDLTATKSEWADRLQQAGATGITLSPRLAIAAWIEALRYNGDAALADDLLLASRAAAQVAVKVSAARDADHGRSKGAAHDKIFEPLTRFSKAFETLSRQRADAINLKVARDEMDKLAGEVSLSDRLEALVFEANAAWVALPSLRAAEGADKLWVSPLDGKIAEDIARSSKEESLRFLEDLARLIQVIDPSDLKTKLTNKDLQLRRLQDIRMVLFLRMGEIPQMASLFLPTASDEPPAALFSASWPRWGTRFHDTQHPDFDAARKTNVGSAVPEESKAYFDALNKLQQGK